VVITSIALTEGKMRPDNAASLVAAGLLSVLLFPVIGLWRMREAGLAVAITDDAAGADDASGIDGTGVVDGAVDAEGSEGSGAAAPG
jgi:hypothetical protein